MALTKDQAEKEKAELKAHDENVKSQDAATKKQKAEFDALAAKVRKAGIKIPANTTNIHVLEKLLADADVE